LSFPNLISAPSFHSGIIASMTTAIAQAFANIAFIKYWGNRDNTLRRP